MDLVSTAEALQPFAQAQPILVPTMGALHDGHIRLIQEAVRLRDSGGGGPVVVTVFVNPTQFNDPADLERYPRTLEADAAKCEAAGANAVFAPSVDTVYPPGRTTPPPLLPAVATQPGLEDAFRPGHFAGVCQVVARLFDLTRPRAALFGEKDWQQLQVIRAMVAAGDTPVGGVQIVPVPTVREPDGLAMSSRNVFLSPDDRRRALALSQALCAACGEPTLAAAELAMSRRLEEVGATVEYAVVRDPETLLPLPPDTSRGRHPGRALIAARVGPVRLIDNAPWS